MGEFRIRSKDPPFDFIASFGDTISMQINIDAPNFFRRIKDAFLTIFGYRTECCINITGRDAARLREVMLESLMETKNEN